MRVSARKTLLRVYTRTAGSLNSIRCKPFPKLCLRDRPANPLDTKRILDCYMPGKERTTERQDCRRSSVAGLRLASLVVTFTTLAVDFTGPIPRGARNLLFDGSGKNMIRHRAGRRCGQSFRDSLHRQHLRTNSMGLSRRRLSTQEDARRSVGCCEGTCADYRAAR